MIYIMNQIIYISLGIILLSICMIYYSFRNTLNAHSAEIISLKKEILKYQENKHLGDLVKPIPKKEHNKPLNTNLEQEYMAYQNNNTLNETNVETIPEDLKIKINNLTIDENSLDDDTELSNDNSSEHNENLNEYEQQHIGGSFVEEPEPDVEEPEQDVEEPNVEEPDVEEPNVEEPDVEEPDVEEPDVEEPEPEPDVEEPNVEEPDVEEPDVEEPDVEEPEPEPDVEEPENILNTIELNSDLTTLSVKELKDIARNNNLKVRGNKTELIERINGNLAK
jgi:hypothetical protein